MRIIAVNGTRSDFGEAAGLAEFQAICYRIGAKHREGVPGPFELGRLETDEPGPTREVPVPIPDLALSIPWVEVLVHDHHPTGVELQGTLYFFHVDMPG